MKVSALLSRSFRSVVCSVGCLSLASPAVAGFGDRDCTFGSAGTQTLPGFSSAYSFSIEPSGDVLVLVGFASTAASLVRVNAAGTTSTTLASVTTGHLDPAIVVLGDGRILLAGNYPGYVSRHLSTGALDGSFGSNGKATMTGFTRALAGPIIQSDGKILVAGTFDGAAAVLRFLADGTPDPSFEMGGVAADAAAGGAYVSLALVPDGRIVAASPSALARYETDGRADASFGVGGRVSLTDVLPESPTWFENFIRVQPSGKILVLGISTSGFGLAVLRIVRFDPSGALDTTVGGGTGYRDVAAPGGPLNAAYSPLVPLALQPDGKPVVVGAVGAQLFGGSGAVVRYGVDLTDDVVVPLDFLPTTVYLLPGGRLLTGVWAISPSIQRRLGDLDPPTCIATSTTVSTFPNPSSFGQPVDLTAIVSPASGSAVPTGLVQFMREGSALGSPVTLSGGAATLTTTELAEGSQTITAVYAGGTGFIGSTSAPLTHIVRAGLAILDGTVAEGSARNAVFRVTLSSALFASAVSVDYATSDGTASAGQDYVATAGTLTFTPGRTVHSILVPIVTDAVAEGSETFTVTLSNPLNASLAQAVATATIADPPAGQRGRMWRSYNLSAFYHFFTASQAEFNAAVANGYRDETTGKPTFYLWNVEQPGSTPLFRMYNPVSGRHYYTAGAYERDSLMTVGWAYERDEGFLYRTQQTGTVEVFRLYNNISGTHLFTGSSATKDAILQQFPGIWVQHTSLGYAYDMP